MFIAPHRPHEKTHQRRERHSSDRGWRNVGRGWGLTATKPEKGDRRPSCIDKYLQAYHRRMREALLWWKGNRSFLNSGIWNWKQICCWNTNWRKLLLWENISSPQWVSLLCSACSDHGISEALGSPDRGLASAPSSPRWPEAKCLVCVWFFSSKRCTLHPNSVKCH